MDLEHFGQPSKQKQRRHRNGGTGRRRRNNRPPISANLVIDHQLRGSLGILSDDLLTDLFPEQAVAGELFPFRMYIPAEKTELSSLTGSVVTGSGGNGNRNDKNGILYVAISPYTPIINTIEDLAWTIVPVSIQRTERLRNAPISPSTLIFPDSTDALQPFIRALNKVDPSRHSLPSQRPIEIRVLDIVPLHLDAVYVSVERHLLRDNDDVQSRFGGGFVNKSAAVGPKGRPTRRNSKKAAMAGAEERLTSAVREALSASNVLHIGDILSMPLPPHPITYASPPPARISLCEPVSQGLLIPTTRIVLIQARGGGHWRQHQRDQNSRSSLLKKVTEDEADDTSNEQFFSAAEDKSVESSTEVDDDEEEEEEEESETEGTMSDSSDDSLDDMISLNAPQLPQAPSGIMSAATVGTPRPGGGGGGSRRTSLMTAMDGGGVRTPGSMISNMTSSTMRPGRGGSGGKVFKAEGLLRSIPSEVLHPKPREDDDVDSFVFVDISTLARIGCFSGDWVRVEEAEEPPRLNGLESLLKIGGDGGEDGASWRPVKVYGLSGLPSPKPRYSINQPATGRRPSISNNPPQRLTPSVFVPPLLLGNLGNPKYLRISSIKFSSAPNGVSSSSSSKPLLHQLKTSAIRNPPVAKEVTLFKILTPLSMDRVLQPALFAGLKQYFESRRRILKSGDLVGLSIDEGLGRAIYSGATGGGDGASQEEDLTVRLGRAIDSTTDPSSKKIGVAWFRVGDVVPNILEEQQQQDEMTGEDQWGGVAIIDSATTRMVQAGSEVSRIPGTLDNDWEYWLGAKVLPKAVGDVSSPLGLITESPPIFTPRLQRRICDLMSAATSLRAIQLGMKPVVILLTSQQRRIGKATVATRACADIGLHTFPIDAFDILTEGGANGGDVKTEAYLKARAERAFHCGPEYTALLIKHIEVLTADRMVTAMNEIVSDSRVVIATTTDAEQIPEGIRSLFTHEFEMNAPEEKEREGILRNAVADRGVRMAADADLASVALKTAALVAGDLVDVVERASAIRAARIDKLAETAGEGQSSSKITVRDVLLSGGDSALGVTKSDFDMAVEAARKNFADAIGAPKIPSVSWEDVGGLATVKDALFETIQLPLERPELFAKGMKKRSGILFYGPPGTGKTLLAKAIATEFSLNFFSVKGPELLNMYIGESEANVRRVFQRARDARPCVVFFDELDSVAPKRGNQGDSGGVMDRIVSQLLAELDGMNGGEENSGGVFVIGATNRPDLLDTALLRPGRFDKMLYLGISDTHAKQATILEALTRKFNLHPDVSLTRVANRLPLNFTGADLYALCSDAMLKAITRKSTAVDEKIRNITDGPVSTAYFFDHLATPDDISVVVTELEFTEAQSELVPSVR